MSARKPREARVTYTSGRSDTRQEAVAFSTEVASALYLEAQRQGTTELSVLCQLAEKWTDHVANAPATRRRC